MKLLGSVPLWDSPNLVSIELLIFSSCSSVEIEMDRNLPVRGLTAAFRPIQYLALWSLSVQYYFSGMIMNRSQLN